MPETQKLALTGVPSVTRTRRAAGTSWRCHHAYERACTCSVAMQWAMPPQAPRFIIKPCPFL